MVREGGEVGVAVVQAALEGAVWVGEGAQGGVGACGRSAWARGWCRCVRVPAMRSSSRWWSRARVIRAGGRRAWRAAARPGGRAAGRGRVGPGAAAQAVAGLGRAGVVQRLGQSGVQSAARESLEDLPGEGLHVGAAVVQGTLQQGFEGVVVVIQGVQHGAQEAFAAGGAFRVEMRAQQVAGGVGVEVAQDAVQGVAVGVAQRGPGGFVGASACARAG